MADTLVFTGCNLPGCPRASTMEASSRDYRVALVSESVSRVAPAALTELEGVDVHRLKPDRLPALLGLTDRGAA
ncbi:hypothetical protein [Streptomyces sp. NPDC059894]|uniref:hypothetical protein n=1 Tax=unclassified Streptomyces TaxID=2593676 RepID=UPI00365AD7F8